MWVWQVGVAGGCGYTSCFLNTWTHVPVERSQCRNEVSSDPETNFKPSTEKCTALAGLGRDRKFLVIHLWIGRSIKPTTLALCVVIVYRIAGKI